MSSYYFYAENKASESFVSSAVRMLLLSSQKIFLVALTPAIWGGGELKCHWDQNFGIPHVCILENSLCLLVTMPNFNSLRWLEVAFFGRFLSRFYGRHYCPLFRKLAGELAEVTLEAHLKPSTITRLLAAGNLTVVKGRFPANCLLYGLEIFVAAAFIKGISCVVQCYNNKSHLRSWSDSLFLFQCVHHCAKLIFF